MAPAAIRTLGLTKHCGRVVALDGLDLEVSPGEIFGFLDPNGAGKSTPIRLLLGLLRPTAGEAWLAGVPVSDVEHAHRSVSYVPGNVSLWPQLTGAETLELLGSMSGGVDVPFRDELLERLDLDPSLRARSYSKGNRQKIALVAALMTRPEILLLDEPTVGFDPLMEAEFQSLAREAAERGQTVFLSSHLLDEVEDLSHRVAVLRTGVLVEVAALEDLRRLTPTIFLRDQFFAERGRHCGARSVGGSRSRRGRRAMSQTAHRGAHELTHTPSRTGRGAETTSPLRDVEPRIVQGARPRRTVLRLYARLIRRGALLMAVGMAAYVGFEVANYNAAYPNGVSPVQFAMFQDNPAVRMMQGVPIALDSAGGFTVWDGGWLIQLLLAVWALLTTSRLLRGEEGLERTDLVLAGPVRATRATALPLVVVAAAALLVGASVTVTMLASGTGPQGSALLRLGFAGVTATFASVAAVTCQLVNARRRATALAAGVLAIAYILRMVGNSTDARSWVRWTTPLGWMDELKPYGDPDLRALLPMLIVPVLLATLAVMLRARRDIGGALLATDAGREPHLRLLGSPTAFAWRSNRAVLLGWILGLGAYAAVMGALISTMIDWLA